MKYSVKVFSVLSLICLLVIGSPPISVSAQDSISISIPTTQPWKIQV